MILIIVVAVVAAVMFLGFGRTVRIVPQARAYVVERLGSYSRTLDAGLNSVVPFIDRVRARVDLREQVVSFAPQPVITEDNLVVHIDTVLYFQVTDPRAATYEIANFIQAIEQLTVTTLRNVIGGMDLESTLTSREQINAELRGVLDEATGKWGIRVNRVELKAIDPPGSIKDAMEKQLRANGTSGPLSPPPKASASRRSSPRREPSKVPSSPPRASGSLMCWSPKGRPKPSAPSLKPSTADARTRSCSPASTCRRCPSWQAATATTPGSSPAN